MGKERRRERTFSTTIPEMISPSAGPEFVGGAEVVCPFSLITAGWRSEEGRPCFAAAREPRTFAVLSERKRS
jgi:hypothetical protein